MQKYGPDHLIIARVVKIQVAISVDSRYIGIEVRIPTLIFRKFTHKPKKSLNVDHCETR